MASEDLSEVIYTSVGSRKFKGTTQRFTTDFIIPKVSDFNNFNIIKDIARCALQGFLTGFIIISMSSTEFS